MDSDPNEPNDADPKIDADFDSTWKIGDETWNLRTIRGGDEPNVE